MTRASPICGSSSSSSSSSSSPATTRKRSLSCASRSPSSSSRSNISVSSFSCRNASCLATAIAICWLAPTTTCFLPTSNFLSFPSYHSSTIPPQTSTSTKTNRKTRTTRDSLGHFSSSRLQMVMTPPRRAELDAAQSQKQQTPKPKPNSKEPSKPKQPQGKNDILTTPSSKPSNPNNMKNTNNRRNTYTHPKNTTTPNRKIDTTNAKQSQTLQNRKQSQTQSQTPSRRPANYQRKQIPESEQRARNLRRERQAEYESLLKKENAEEISKTGFSLLSIWSFESLFPDPVVDLKAVKRDLYAIRDQDRQTQVERSSSTSTSTITSSTSSKAENPVMRVFREPELGSSSSTKPKKRSDPKRTTRATPAADPEGLPIPLGDAAVASNVQDILQLTSPTSSNNNKIRGSDNQNTKPPASSKASSPTTTNSTRNMVDLDLSRMVEDRMYGYRRTQSGSFQYETSLMDDGAVKFRDGVRLSNPLSVNADRLTYMAKKELQHGRVEEAKEYYEMALQIAPRDGRAYLGLSRCAERRKDFTLARECLQAGVANSVASTAAPTTPNQQQLPPDRGANPFLLQALGTLDEKMGRLTQAEAWYIAAAKSRPSHAAAWVSLALLRTRKLGQSANAGRACFQAAARELANAGLPPSSHVCTAWASLEHKAGNSRRAKELFLQAVEIDPKCSVAWLQLGVMEAQRWEHWDEAEDCFERVLKFDGRNSRVLQAYALMETKRPNGSSRKAIGLFERAIKAKPRDAGVLQAYALYVAELGDIEAARSLLRRGTQVSKRHAAVWQAWGVLEMREGNIQEARTIFQQGIWACAHLAGGQSGGYKCARLWQAWGVLESQQGKDAEARRCFSRALDADSRNIAAVTAWARMEEDRGNLMDARAIFERALRNFSAGSNEKNTLWRSYEAMEQHAGDLDAAQYVHQRSMREAMIREEANEKISQLEQPSPPKKITPQPTTAEVDNSNNEVEVSRWDGGGSEVWMNDRAIEARVPFDMKMRKKNT